MTASFAGKKGMGRTLACFFRSASYRRALDADKPVLWLGRRFHATASAPSSSPSPSSSVSADELSHFSALASSWWDPVGPSRILHLMNPLRHDFIASCLAESQPASAPPPQASGLHYLDVGCGGGIFAESLARTIPLPTQPVLGGQTDTVSQQNQLSGQTQQTQLSAMTRAASIVAIDPSEALIKIARMHARRDPVVDAHLRSGVFQYRNTTLEDLAAPTANATATAAPPTFDVITLFEVLEHVDPMTSSPPAFLAQCLRLLRPGGWLIGSTIARTLPSFIVNQLIAEAPWPIGVVPRGTHEWSKFVNPDELRSWAGLGLDAAGSGSSARQPLRWKCTGVMYFPGLGWKMVAGSETWGNYFWAVRRAEDPASP